MPAPVNKKPEVEKKSKKQKEDQQKAILDPGGIAPKGVNEVVPIAKQGGRKTGIWIIVLFFVVAFLVAAFLYSSNIPMASIDISATPPSSVIASSTPTTLGTATSTSTATSMSTVTITSTPTPVTILTNTPFPSPMSGPIITNGPSLFRVEDWDDNNPECESTVTIYGVTIAHGNPPYEFTFWSQKAPHVIQATGIRQIIPLRNYRDYVEFGPPVIVAKGSYKHVELTFQDTDGKAVTWVDDLFYPYPKGCQ